MKNAKLQEKNLKIVVVLYKMKNKEIKVIRIKKKTGIINFFDLII